MAQPTNLVQGPEPVETAELHFKLHCRLKVFDMSTKYSEGHCCILAVSQYYGLVFVGNLNGFSVISTKSLTAGTSPDEFPKRNITLNVKPAHISVDISQRILVVVCNSKPSPVLIFYNIQSFGAKDVTPFKITPISKLLPNSTAEVVDLIWQPNADGSFVVCMSDGSVLALPQGTKNEAVFALPETTQATCFCWSPKGKQIVIGAANGTLSQYKPDLKLVKTLPAPPLYNGAVMVVSVLWISSFQFAVAYNDRTSPESFPVITIVNAAKNEPVTVINYDDITYSSTLFRNHQIYMSHQPAWNVVFVSSANSIETAVLHSKNSSLWEQWLLGDASRAELPLNPDRQETFPLGWAFDFTSQEGIPWGEGSLPPMPRLLLVSDEGLLCVFNVVNAAADAPQLCAPPKETLDQSHFTVSVKPAPSATSDLTPPVQPGKGILGSPPNLAAAKPFSFQASPGFGGFAAKLQPKSPQDGAPNLQKQPEQPQLQTPQQPPAQPQQQLPPPTQQPAPPESTASPFKLSISQFGAPPTFSFGSGSTTAFPFKPPTAKPPEATAAAFALQPSASQKDLFAGKSLPQSTPVKQAEAPVEKSGGGGRKGEEVEACGRAEDVPAKGESPEVSAVDESVYLSALQEEVEHFNSELQQLSERVGTLEVQVGTEEEKGRMKRSIEGLQGFWRELKETTEGQSGEIHAVVLELMEAFAWLENAKSRNLQRKNPSYIELKKSEELDPLNVRHMNEISHLKYYIENQLKQLTGYLEKEWMDHQENYRNEIKNKMAVPPLEEVYKTMHYQLKILQKQKALVEELKDKLAVKKRKNKSQSFISSADPIRTDTKRVSELSKLAENLLQLKINREEDSPQPGPWDLMKSRLAAISDRSRKLTRDKQAALRDVLTERDMVKIRPVKTTLESSTFLRSLHKAPSKTPKPTPFLTPQRPKDSPNTPPIPPLEHNTQPPLPPPHKSPAPPKPDPPNTLPAPDNPPAPPTLHPFPITDDRSPLTSLSRIVSNLPSKTDNTPFVFRSTLHKPDVGKDLFSTPKPDLKQEEPKPPQPFTFGAPKPPETLFPKKDTPVFAPKPPFNLPSSISIVLTKSDTTKTTPTPSVTITPVTTATPVAPFTFSAPNTAPPPTSSSFTFTPSTTAPPTSTPLPKVNLLFGKETPAPFPTPSTSTSPSLFSSSLPLFGNPTKTTFSTSLFGPPKTTDAPTNPSPFPPPHPEPKPPPTPDPLPTPPNSTTDTPDIDVVSLDEPPKKPETPSDNTKDSPKPTPTPSVFTSPAPLKSTESTPTPTPVSTPPTSTPTLLPKSLPATLTPPDSSPAPAPTPAPAPPTGPTPPTTTTASLFSFSSPTSTVSPVFFPHTTTTSTPFPSSTSTPTPFAQVSSTTPTTNIFGSPSPSTNIFGSPTPPKPTPDQPSTTSNTPTTTFPQPSTPSVFPQKTDSVDTTANLFGQLLSDTNKPVFGSSPTPTPTTTPNIFSSPKTIFETPSTTTASLFGTSFGSSVFGQTTTASTVFGQPQTSTANSFFGQSSFNAFGKASSPTPGQTPFKSTAFNEPIFGSSVFGQTFKRTTNATTFGTPTASIFGGAPTSTTTNVFHTPTTTTTFGSSAPGPFSGGTSSFGESAFGSSTATFQKPLGGFGSPPVFGGAPPAPAFGGSPTFGGSHSFGSLPTFGSVSQGAFGQTAGSTTFENLASQNTVGFGNLAQQSQSQGFGGGFGSPSFENKSAFGGNSFSSWRSK